MDNPQAYPCLDNDGYTLQLRDPGMTLRDYFAAAALPCVNVEGCGSPSDNLMAIANAAYKVADAMLAERRKSREASRAFDEAGL